MSKQTLESIINKINSQQQATSRRSAIPSLENTTQENNENNTNQGNVLSRSYATLSDVAKTLETGVVGALEGVVDFGASIIGNVGDEGFKRKIENFVKKDYTKDIVKWTNKPTDWFFDSLFNGGEDSTGQSYINELDDNTQNITRGVIGSIGQIAPSMLLGGAGSSQAVSTALSMGSFGVGAGGGAIQDAVQGGSELTEATQYGLLEGGKEVATELVVGKALGVVGLGANKVFGATIGRNAINTVVSEVAEATTKQTAKRILTDFAKSTFEEGIEEVAGDLLDPLIEKVTIDKDKDLASAYNLENGLGEQLFMDFLSGAITGGIMNGAQTGSIVAEYGLDGIQAIDSFNEAQGTLNDIRTKINNGTISTSEFNQAQSKLQESFDRFIEKSLEIEKKRGKGSKKVKALESYVEATRKLQEYASELPDIVKATNIKSMAELGEVLGVEVNFGDGSTSYIETKENGDRRIVFGQEITDSFSQTLRDMVHETVHFTGLDSMISTVVQSSNYPSIRRSVESIYTEANIKEELIRQGKFDEAKNFRLTNEYINNEVVARYFEEIISNTAEFNKILNDRTSIYKIKSFFGSRAVSNNLTKKDRRIAKEMVLELNKAINRNQSTTEDNTTRLSAKKEANQTTVETKEQVDKKTTKETVEEVKKNVETENNANDNPTKEVIKEEKTSDTTKAEPTPSTKTQETTEETNGVEPVKKPIKNKTSSEKRIDKAREKATEQSKRKETNDSKRSRYATKTAINEVDKTTRIFVKALDNFYTVSHNKPLVEKAHEEMKKLKTQKEVISKVREIRNRLTDNTKVNKYDIVLGSELIKYISKSNQKATDVRKECAELIHVISAVSTEYGQIIQLVSLVKSLTPENRLKVFNIAVKRQNNKYANQNRKINKRMVNERRATYEADDLKLAKETLQGDELTKNIQEISRRYSEEFFLIPDTLAKNLTEAKTDEDIEKAGKDIWQCISKQETATLWEKLESFRICSMLANPKTHIRNIIGNVVMGKVTDVKNVIARSLESIFVKDKSKRTKKTASHEMLDYAETIYTNDFFKGDGKYQFLNDMTVFNTKFLENIRKFNFGALEGADLYFCRKMFIKSFASYTTAKGYTIKELKAKDSMLKEAIEYSVEEAQRATFKEYSQLAEALNEFQSKNAVTRFLTSAIMPFKKTPINIAKQALRYSPVMLIKTFTKGTHDLHNGRITLSAYIDNISMGLTGTGIFALGIFLAQIGLLTLGDDDDDSTKDEYDELRGKQNYSLNIGGVSFTMDWLSPSAIPLFMGVAIAESVQNEEDIPQALYTSALGMLDPITEMSVLSSVNNVLSSYDDNKITGIAKTTAKNYGTSFIPTLAGQIAKVIDPVRRKTTATGKTGIAKEVESFGRSMIAKLPGFSMCLEPYIDVWGNTDTNYNGFATFCANALEQTVSPGWWSTNKATTKVDTEIMRLYQLSGNSDIIPYTPSAYYTQNGVRIDMTPKEYTEYKQIFGKTSYNTINAIINQSWYTQLDNESREKLISSSYSIARDFTRKQGNLYEYAKNISTMDESSIIAHYLYLRNCIEETYDRSKKRLTYDYINQLNLTRANKTKLFNLLGYKLN